MCLSILLGEVRHVKGPQCGAPRLRRGRASRAVRRPCFIFANGMESLSAGNDLALSDIESDAGSATEMFDYTKQGDHIVGGIGDQCAIVRIPFAGEAEATRSYVVALM